MKEFKDNTPDPFGNLADGVKVEIRHAASGIKATLFADAAGSVGRANPLISAGGGIVQCFMADGDYLAIVRPGETGERTYPIQHYDLETMRSNVDDIQTVAGGAESIEAVAGAIGDVSAVAAVSSDVGTVATVAPLLPTIATNAESIEAAAANAEDITTCAANITDIVAAPGHAATVVAIKDTLEGIGEGEGASTVGIEGGGNVQGALDARPTTAALASSSGASAIGAEGGGTVQDGLNKIEGIPSLAQFQRLMSKLDNATEDAAMGLAGDSTGDAANEWFYLLGTKLAALYPAWTIAHRAWNDGAGNYDAATTIQVGSGPRTLTLYNASIAGSVANRHAGDNFAAAIGSLGLDLLFISYGHNGSTTGPRQLDFFDALAFRLKRDTPLLPVVQIGQNPTLNDETMAAKIAVLRPAAARCGWGFISVHDAFKQAGVPLSTLLVDTVHPNAAGSALWCDTVLASMIASRAAFGDGTAPPRTLIRAWVHPSEFKTWTAVNCTVADDTTHWETVGRSTSLTCTAPGLSYISTGAIGGDDIIALRGKWVTFAALLYVPPGNDGSSGRIDLVDSGGTTSAVGVQQGSGFILFSCRKLIDANATTLTIFVYPSAADGVTNSISISRASLAMGMEPVDVFPAFSTFTRMLRVHGSDADGIGRHRNASTTAVGHVFVDADGTAMSNFAADGFYVKQAADTHYRYALTAGGFHLGPGNADFDMALDRQIAGIMRLSGADLYPDTNTTRYLGGVGANWRGLFLRGTGGGDGLFINDVRVLGAQGAAVADATDAASAITQLNALLARCRAHGIIAT